MQNDMPIDLPTVTSFYAALITMLLIALSARVILNRRRIGASVGDKGDAELRKAIRVQGNLVEYAPLGLILMALLEVQGASALPLHLLGLLLLGGRIAHMIGFGRSPQIMALRVGGMAMTLTMLGLSAVWLLGLSLF